MKAFVVLIRGVNVGGKNKLSMVDLKTCLETLGFANVKTYIASGNVILQSDKSAAEVQRQIEAALPQSFKLDSRLVKVLVLSLEQLRAIVAHRPKGFGDQPQTYYSDVVFLMDIDVSAALKVFSPKEGVDVVWPGDGVIYSQRLGALRTKSHLSRIVGTPAYQSMTVRTWGTITKLLELLEHTNDA